LPALISFSFRPFRGTRLATAMRQSDPNSIGAGARD
jgi:hypothetical protein